MPDKQFFSRLESWLRANTLAWSEIRAKTSWLRGMRKARGLRGLDMARKLGVSPARISMLEADEDRGAVTLKMMQKAAQALDCEFVYVLIPKQVLAGGQPAGQKSRVRVQTGTAQQ